ncbi:MAG: nicotinate-nucleotide adenylyltransferase [Pseudomonadota bacterium]
MTAPRQGMAVLGGTFDPVHFGHLRSAVEVREALGVARIKLIPSFSPPHRNEPASSARDRLAMLRAATADHAYIEVDDREIRREGRSFTIDTLRSIREELGDSISLAMVLGVDAFVLLDSWKAWRHLTDTAHLVVLDRPRADQRKMSAELKHFFDSRFVDDPGRLASEPCGLVCRLSLTQLDISSSRIREILRAGLSADYLMPSEAIAYLRQHGLYGSDQSTPQ